MFLYFQLSLIRRSSQNQKGSTAPRATEKSIPDRSSGSARLNRWFHRAYSGWRDDRCNSKYSIFHVLKELIQSGCSCNPLPCALTSMETDGQGWKESPLLLLPRTKIICPGHSHSGLVSVYCSLFVTSHSLCQRTNVAS